MADTAHVNGELSLASSRLDASLLRYALMFRSRMNMLVLDRELRTLAGEQGLLKLRPGITRSSLRFRAEATLQFAVELALGQPHVVRWADGDALRRQMTIDAAYYQADRWLRGLPPALALPRFPDPVPELPKTGGSDADGLPDALREFVLYLWRCSRLDEVSPPREPGTAQSAAPAAPPEGHDAAYGDDGIDELDEEPVRPRLAGGHDSASVPPLALQRLRMDGAYRVLRSIARDVARRLLRDGPQWRQAAEACAGHPGFRQPPPELFNALLLGKDALIGLDPGDGGRQWQFSSDGVRRGAALEAGQGGVKPAQAMRAEIRAADQVLAQALGIDGALALCWLADVFSLLPTTPAWADVELAFAALPGDEEPTSRATVPAEELHKVTEFYGLVNAHFDTVALGLLAAAALRDTALPYPQAGDEPPMLRALRLLEEGLRFRETDLDSIRRKLVQRWPDLTWPPAVASDGMTPSSPPSLAWRSNELPKALAGRRTLPTAIDSSPPARARFFAWAATGRVDDASLAELHDAARLDGVMRWVRLNPGRMTLHDWGRVVAAVVSLQPQAAPWLAVIGLQRLGVNTLSRAQQQRLLSHLSALDPHDTTDGLADSARRAGVWRPDGQGVGTLIFLRVAASPLNDNWRRPPTRGLLLPLTVEEAELLLLYKSRAFLRALPQPVRVLVEGEPEDAKPLRGLVARLLSASHGENLVRRVKRRWRLLATSERTLARSTPVNPDDLFGTAQPSGRVADGV